MYVNETVVNVINLEINMLENQVAELRKVCQKQNKDIRFVAAYSQLTDQIARLRKSIKPLVNQYY